MKLYISSCNYRSSCELWYI